MAHERPDHFESSESFVDRNAWPIIAIVCLGFAFGVALLVVAIVTGP